MQNLTLVDRAFLLKQISVFRRVDWDSLMAIANKLGSLKLPPRQIIFRAQDSAFAMYVIAEGRVEIHPNKLKNWDPDLAQAPGLDPQETASYRNMDPVPDAESRENSLKSKTDPSVCLGTYPGKDQHRSSLEQGEFFGEEALFNGRRRDYTALAATKTHLLTLSHSDLDVVLLECPSVALGFLELYSAALPCRPLRL